MPRAALFLLVLALGGCGGDDKSAAPTDGVKELTNVLDLRADFEADAGTTRAIVLLSPT